MAHWSYSLCGLATLAMLCAGCAANRPNQSHATLDRRAPSSLKSQADSTRPGRARVSAAPAEMAPGDQTFSSTGTRGAESDVLRTAGTRAGRATPDRDPQLAAVIDQELQDATPDERASYQAAFEGKSPEAIRGILRGRRLARGHELASAPTAVPVGHAASYHLGKSAGTNSSGADPVSAPRATMNDGNPPDGPANPNIRLTSETAGGQAHPETAGVDSAAAGGKAQVASAEALTADVTVQAQLEKLIPLAEADAAACQPGPSEAELQSYIKKHFDLRMLYLMAGQQERALQAIPGIDPVDQEFFQQTLWGLTNYFDASSIPAAADRATQTVAQLQSAVLRLQEKANLELRNVAFCHKISSFGNYEKYSRDEFSPGQEVLVYAEVAHIHSAPTADGKFRTNLKSTLEVARHGAESESTERIDMPETVDVCRSHRRDYFHVYQFTIPTNLSPGAHVLKLSVEDQLSRRVATYSLNFMVK